MGTKSILLAVADPQTLADIHQALGTEWEASSVASEAEALGQLDRRPFDALLVDFNLGEPDASELLNQALDKRPDTGRFLLAHEADLALVAAKVFGSHEILPKPIDSASLKSRIEKGLSRSDSDQSGSDPAADAGAPPTIPSIYTEVLTALDSPGVTSRQVGEIIARDAALTTEVLRLTRSAYMGVPRNLSDPVEAVESLGLETVKALVMALRFLAEHSQLKPGYLSLDQIWQHSINVAQIARDLILFETKNRPLASQALVAGLLHDLGKVVLATNFDDLYGRVHSLARKQPVPLWEVEKEMFGANHGEIGGCLLGMWNMPGPIVEAAALHHEPPTGEHEDLTPLAAVHIANVLEHQLRPNEEYQVAPIINSAFLNELGLLQRLPVWRATFANQTPAKQKSQVEPAEAPQAALVTPMLENALKSRTANHLPGPAATTRTTTSGQPGEELRQAIPAVGLWQRRWVYAGIAAGVLCLLCLWILTQPDIEEPAPVYARTPATAIEPVVVASTPSIEAVPAPGSQATPVPASSQSEPATNASSISEPALARPSAETPSAAAPQPVPESTSVVASQPTITNVTAVTLPPKEKTTPEFRLTGIIYGVASPSAIVNGKTVYVGDQVSGATVVSIGQTTVTLRHKSGLKTYALR